MARYDFKCPTCESMKLNVHLSMMHERSERPHCCGKPMETYITVAPMVHWKHYEFEGGGFQTISAKRGQNEVITTHKQHKEYLKKHNLRVAEYNPPTHEEQTKLLKEANDSISAISSDGKEFQGKDIVGVN